MLAKIISGGQTGAEQAGWRAAKAFGIPTGGAMPRGFLTEAGPRPEFAELYGAVELETGSYAARTEANVRDSDATLWFGSLGSAGYHGTVGAALEHRRPVLVIQLGEQRPSDVKKWIDTHKYRVINVAGRRESLAPGIGERVERFLADVFRQLGHKPG
jgi:Circularly permutated YpsA SLOG family